MSDTDIQFSVEGGLARILLNRPAALNALTLDMVHALDAKLEAWAGDGAVKAVVIEGAGGKAFCAGGDIQRLYETGKAGDPYARRFFFDEYKLNRRIFRFPKPYIAYLDGITMGGGVGVSVHGSHRIGGEGLTFAMPETGIGLFPDVGGGYFLPRLTGEIGMFLGLTGYRLRVSDALYAGVIDAFVPRADWPALRATLGRAASRDEASAAIKKVAKDPGACAIAPHRALIDRCFAGTSVEGIVAALDTDGSDFAKAQAAALRTKSPTSLKIAFQQIRRGKFMEFEDVMTMEYRMASGCMVGRDFFEGVRAVVIDKDNKPTWQPATLEALTTGDLDPYLSPARGGDLTFDD